MASEAAAIDPTPAEPETKPKFHRIEWLDGVRGCAALFVVLHHTYLAVFPGRFPTTDGPWGFAFLMYGHLAVVVFIVVSGFSLGLAPTRQRNDVKHGARKFYHRRAWRILPPYWIALVISLLVDWYLLTGELAAWPQHAATFRSFVIHALLLQDVLPSQSPNSAFWSIAVEAQIYILFPFMIVMSQRLSVGLMVASTVVLVVLAQMLAMTGRPYSAIIHLSPALLVAFSFGIWAAGEVNAPKLPLPMLWIGAALAVALGVFFGTIGIAEVAANFFWVDVAVGAVVAILFVGLTQARSPLGWVLSSWPLSKLGEFAYSLYLTHGAFIPLIVAYLWVGRGTNPYLSYLTAAAVVIPSTVLIAYAFFWMFERPFLTIRSWAQLLEAVGLVRKPRKASADSLIRAAD
jgi:peptidoglycan/LPS O-acetylase OafA/YrhL